MWAFAVFLRRHGPLFPIGSGSSSLELGLLFRAISHRSPARVSRAFPGVSFLLHDVSRTSSLVAGSPRAHLRSALSVSRALDGLLLVLPRRFVSPHCRVRGSLLEGFPFPPAAMTLRLALPSCRWPGSPAVVLRQLPKPRLQGLSPTDSPLRTLITPARALLELVASSGLTPSTSARAFTRPPLMTSAVASHRGAGGWPSAYRSVLGLSFCLQISFPVRALWPSFGR
jgi:hypothetical protein